MATDRSVVQQVGVSGVCIGLGVLLATVGLAYGALPRLFGVTLLTWPWAVGIGAVGVVLALVGWRLIVGTARALPGVEGMDEGRRSAVLFGRHLVGVGFALLIDAAFTLTVFAAMARIMSVARLPLMGDEFDAKEADAFAVGSGDPTVLERFGNLFGTSPQEADFVAVMLVLSSFVALLGALFFFATSLWKKMDDRQAQEAFDPSLFWAGLWFRIGEALVFNLVLFLVVRAFLPDRFLILPLMALLVGMFLKSGEQLISGLATRMFDAFAELVPAKLPGRTLLRVLDLALEGAFGDGEVTPRARELVASLGKVEGVTRVLPDPMAEIVRVEYDAQVVGRGRIVQEVRLFGFQDRA